MIKDVIQIAKEAGKILMKYYSQDLDLDIQTKSSEFDLVTRADIESDEFIRKALGEKFPDDLILSEECNNIPDDFSGRVWMVDPLDGTSAFVEGGAGFSVLIGLCKDGIPILGVMYAPALEKLYWAEKGKGSFLEFKEKTIPLRVSKVSKINQATNVTGYMQRLRPRHKMILSLPVLKRIQETTGGLKIGLVSEKKADVFLQSTNLGCKWDTCAPQVILEEAGGRLTNDYGGVLDYKQKALNWEDSFVASNGLLHEAVVEHIQK